MNDINNTSDIINQLIGQSSQRTNNTQELNQNNEEQKTEVNIKNNEISQEKTPFEIYQQQFMDQSALQKSAESGILSDRQMIQNKNRYKQIENKFTNAIQKSETVINQYYQSTGKKTYQGIETNFHSLNKSQNQNNNISQNQTNSKEKQQSIKNQNTEQNITVNDFSPSSFNPGNTNITSSKQQQNGQQLPPNNNNNNNQENENNYHQRESSQINNSLFDFTLLYQGDYKNGFKHGYGILSLNDKNNTEIYKGDFNQDEYHGQGKLLNINCQISKLPDLSINLPINFDFKEYVDNFKQFEGDFKNNKFHSFGTLILSTNDTIIGNFSEGMINGQASLKLKNNKNDTIIGIWENNKITQKFL